MPEHGSLELILGENLVGSLDFAEMVPLDRLQHCLLTVHYNKVFVLSQDLVAPLPSHQHLLRFWLTKYSFLTGCRDSAVSVSSDVLDMGWGY